MALPGSASSLRERLAAIHDEMDGLEAKLHWLLAQERDRVVQGLNCIVYPVLSLPVEITTEIFTHYVDDPHIGPTTTPGRGPLVLASVCRRWREICLSVGSLWASLRVYQDPDYATDEDISQGLLSLLHCWLPRAGRQPLDLRIFRSYDTSEIFLVLSQYSQQWRSIGVTLYPLLDFPDAAIVGRVPCLTTLAVTILDGEDYEPVMISAFSEAPCLREVRLSGGSHHWISLPWVQLTHLDLMLQALPASFEILRQTPNLEALRVLTLQDDDDSLSGSIIIPKLHTLQLPYDPFGTLLDHLTLPALQTLELTALKSSSEFCRLVQRSGCSLRSIHLTAMGDNTSISCLEAVPSLETLEIHNTGWPDYDWEQLTSLLNHAKGFLPSLRALTLGGHAVRLSIGSLVGMLESRSQGTRDGVAKLELAHLAFESASFPVAALHSLKTRLRPLRNTGMNVAVGVVNLD